MSIKAGQAQELITQSTFVDRLLKLITTDAMDDRDRIKRQKSLERATSSQAEKLVFRNMFIDDQDPAIARNLWNYFRAVDQRWNNAWNDLDRGRILARTTGFAALIRVLPQALKLAGKPEAIPSEGDFLKVLKKCTLTDGDFTSVRYLPGSTGEGDLVRDMLRDLQ